MLPLCPTLYTFRCRFNSNIEAVKVLEELVAVEGTACECLDYLLDLSSDDIAIYEVGVVENGTEKALSEEVLNEHFVDDFCADLRVKRCAAEFGKRIESRNELLIELMFPFNDRQ